VFVVTSISIGVLLVEDVVVADIADRAALFDPLSITTAAGEYAAADVGGADILTGLMLREDAAEARALLITLLPVAVVFVTAPTSKVKTTPA
jgi:hypothetical protein